MLWSPLKQAQTAFRTNSPQPPPSQFLKINVHHLVLGGETIDMLTRADRLVAFLGFVWWKCAATFTIMTAVVWRGIQLSEDTVNWETCLEWFIKKKKRSWRGWNNEEIKNLFGGSVLMKIFTLKLFWKVSRVCRVFFFFISTPKKKKKNPEQLISVIGTFNQRGGNNQWNQPLLVFHQTAGTAALMQLAQREKKKKKSNYGVTRNENAAG